MASVADITRRLKAEDPYYAAYIWNAETDKEAPSVPLKPVRKVTAAGLGGALSILLVFILGQFGIVMTVEAAAAVATVMSFAAGYLVPASADDEQIVN